MNTGSDKELKRGPWSCDTSKEDLLSIIDNVPCGIVVNKTLMGEVLYINKASFDLCGYTVQEIPTGEKAHETFPADRESADRQLENLKKDLEKGQAMNVMPVVCKSGQTKTVEIRASLLSNGMTVSMWTDITKEAEVKKVLKEKEAMFRSFFEDCSDPVLLLEGSRIMDCNSAALKTLEFPAKQMLRHKKLSALSFTDTLTSNSLPDIGEQIETAAIDGNSRQFEWVFKKQTGLPFQAEVRISPVSLGSKKLWYLMLRDISLWKDTEKALLYTKDKLEEHIKKRTAELESVNRKLKNEISRRKKTEKMLEESRADLKMLSEHLQRTREEERTMIARDVHDELGQTLSVLKIDAAFLKKNIKAGKGAVFKRLHAMEDQIDDAISSVREICTKLRPPVLEDFGLSACIEWFFRDIEKRTGIKCFLDLQADIPVDKKELSLMLFRILQESATNILRHAKATRINICLKVEKNNVTATVEDNGIGMTEKQAAGQSGFGIIGIKERVRFWGGTSRFSGKPGKGTIVSVRVPVDSSSGLSEIHPFVNLESDNRNAAP